MKSSLYLIVFVLAVATAYAVSQSQPPAAPANGAPSAQSGTSSASPQPATKGDEDTARPGAAQQEKSPDTEKAPATSGGSDDASLQTQVQQQLATQNFSNVTVSVSNGVVTLTGSVPSKADRKRVKELAKNVAGVRRVSEKLEVNPKAAAAPASTPNTAGSIAGNAEAAGGTQAPTSPTMAGTTSASGTTASQSTPAASGTASTQSTPSAATQAAPATSAGVSGTTGGVSGSASTTTGAGSAQPGTTGAVAGSTGATAGTTAAGTTTATTTAEDSQLQTQIDGALKNEPTLSGANVIANVTADTIELSGSVPTGKEKQTARRIAQSFAGNRRLVDRLTVTGNGANNPSTVNPPDNSQNPKGDATSPKR